jgi:hypothetical protein
MSIPILWIIPKQLEDAVCTEDKRGEGNEKQD